MKKMKQFIALFVILAMMTGLFSAVMAEEISAIPEAEIEEAIEAVNVTEMVIETENIPEDVTVTVNETVQEEPVPEIAEDAEPVADVTEDIMETTEIAEKVPAEKPVLS